MNNGLQIRKTFKLGSMPYKDYKLLWLCHGLRHHHSYSVTLSQWSWLCFWLRLLMLLTQCFLSLLNVNPYGRKFYPCLITNIQHSDQSRGPPDNWAQASEWGQYANVTFGWVNKVNLQWMMSSEANLNLLCKLLLFGYRRGDSLKFLLFLKREWVADLIHIY